MDKRIILLNGPSSSGKTTLAKALQALLQERNNERFEIVSIDDLLEMSPDEAIYEDDVYEIAEKMCGRVSECLRTAPGVIVDHVITSERIFRKCKEAFAPYPTILVHVTCPPEELKRREAARGDRCTGSALASYEYLFPKDGYDATADTHGMTVEECCAAICRLLE